MLDENTLKCSAATAMLVAGGIASKSSCAQINLMGLDGVTADILSNARTQARDQSDLAVRDVEIDILFGRGRQEIFGGVFSKV